jgi:hypothetical protein
MIQRLRAPLYRWWRDRGVGHWFPFRRRLDSEFRVASIARGAGDIAMVRIVLGFGVVEKANRAKKGVASRLHEGNLVSPEFFYQR